MTIERNCLTMQPDELDTPIYRVFDVAHLIDAFEQDNNTLVTPAKWDDPFENVILRMKWTLKGGTRFGNAMRDQVYGQCWSTKAESDAMWRIYSPQRQGVRVTTTPRALLTSLWVAVPKNPELSSFIGSVEYYDTDELYRHLKDRLSVAEGLIDPTGQSQALSLLIKRREFDHEHEVRLIHIDLVGAARPDGLFQYAMNPRTLFTHLQFDPRLAESMVDVFMQHLRGPCDYDGLIDQSSLYSLPDDLLDGGEFPF